MLSFESAGLGEFKFDFNYNTPGLNTWSSDTLAFCGIWQLPKVAPRSLAPTYTGNDACDYIGIVNNRLICSVLATRSFECRRFRLRHLSNTGVRESKDPK